MAVGNIAFVFALIPSLVAMVADLGAFRPIWYIFDTFYQFSAKFTYSAICNKKRELNRKLADVFNEITDLHAYSLAA